MQDQNDMFILLIIVVIFNEIQFVCHFVATRKSRENLHSNHSCIIFRSASF